MSSNLYTSPARQYFPEEGTVARAPSENMLWNFIVLLRGIRGVDFNTFIEEHRRLYERAKERQDHGEVTSHYYSVMSAVVEQYYGESFHFVPPEFKGQTRPEAARSLHQLIGRILQHGVGKHSLDIGCGIGSTMADIARYTGGKVTGITVAPNEVQRGNQMFAEGGLSFLCEIVEGDCNDMKCLEEESMDSAYAIYALKYFPDLRPVFAEVKRVLKPGGFFLIYDLVKTDYFETTKKDDDRELIEKIEFACGMPALHSNPEMKAFGKAEGLEVVAQMDVTMDPKLPWFYTFIQNPWLMWMMESRIVDFFVQLAEWLRILPRGFAEFNRIFLGGTSAKLVRAGQRRIITGSNVLVLRKPPIDDEFQDSRSS